MIWKQPRSSPGLSEVSVHNLSGRTILLLPFKFKHVTRSRCVKLSDINVDLRLERLPKVPLLQNSMKMLLFVSPSRKSKVESSLPNRAGYPHCETIVKGLGSLYRHSISHNASELCSWGSNRWKMSSTGVLNRDHKWMKWLLFWSYLLLIVSSCWGEKHCPS